MKVGILRVGILWHWSAGRW